MNERKSERKGWTNRRVERSKEERKGDGNVRRRRRFGKKREKEIEDDMWRGAGERRGEEGRKKK
jgi:hypothetical protein